MTLPIRLTNAGNSVNLVHVGRVSILFSYDTAVAFNNNGDCLVDPSGYSQTTAKHIAQNGYKHDPRAKDRAAFEAALSKALKGAFK